MALEQARFSVERVRADLLERYGEDLLLLETRRDATGEETVVAVIDGAPGTDALEAKHLSQVHGVSGEPSTVGAPRFEVLDRAGFTMLQRLIETGIVRFASEDVRRLHEVPGLFAPVQVNGGEEGAVPRPGR